MGKTSIENPKNTYYEEIDLFDLFQKIWKWKWLTCAIVIFFSLTTFFYVKAKPDIYNSSAIIQIGKIADVPIEKSNNVQAYLKYSTFHKDDVCSTLVTCSEINKNTIMLSCSSNSPDVSFSCLDKATENLIKRQNKSYNKALKKIKDNINSIKTKTVIKPVYILDTYTFPTFVISKSKIPNQPDNKKLIIKLAVAFVSSLLIGIFLSFFIEYISTRQRQK